MCYEIKCSTCGKRSWEGCGRHVVSVYNKIPDGQHCHCKAWTGVQTGQNPASSGGDGDSSSSNCTIL